MSKWKEIGSYAQVDRLTSKKKWIVHIHSHSWQSRLCRHRCWYMCRCDGEVPQSSIFLMKCFSCGTMVLLITPFRTPKHSIKNKSISTLNKPIPFYIPTAFGYLDKVRKLTGLKMVFESPFKNCFRKNLLHHTHFV